MAAKDETVALLTEIRDLLKENNAITLHSKKSLRRSLILKVFLNGAIVIFACIAIYFYYHTLVTSLGG